LTAVLPAHETPDLTAPLTFDALGLDPRLVTALARQQITEPTPVQAAVVPDAMSGADVLGRARTGSGKTLAFGLPMLSHLAGRRSRPKRPRGLIVVPTRELAQQVRRSLEPLAGAVSLRLATVYGGTPYDGQIRRLRGGVDVVVATPGRLRDLIDRGALRTDDIAMTVLDEADHLCDLGFYPEVDALLRETPTGQRMLLSATLDNDVDRLVRAHLREPRLHELDPNQGAVTTMDHHVLVVGGYRDKVAATAALVEANPRTIVFTRTRQGATELRDSLGEHGIDAVDLHGNLSQRLRERNLRWFSTGRVQVVVATDVAARGIHVDHVGLVVHYDAPSDPKAYLHRSGRTARAGESGAVVTITTPRHLDEVLRLQQHAGVQPRSHDIRTAPRPLTVEALAASGEQAPRPGGRSRGGSAPRRSPRSGPRSPQRSGLRSAPRGQQSPQRGGRRDEERRTTSGRPSRDKKPRWSNRDRSSAPGRRSAQARGGS